MMRQACAWMVMGVLLVGSVASAFAQSAPATSAPATAAPASPASPAAPAKAAAKPEAAKAVAKLKTKSAAGMVKSASADSLVLVGKDQKELTFGLGPDTKITKAGKAAAAKDLAEHDSVTVQYTEADGKMVAKSVTAKIMKPVAKKPQS